MSRKPQASSPVPPETIRVARAAYPQGNSSLKRRETLGSSSTDEDGADRYPKEGQPAEAPWRLALVSVMPCGEHLSPAVRGRRDGTSLPGLERDDPGGAHCVLAAFRQRLVAGNQERRIVDQLRAQLRAGGDVKARGRQGRDFTPVIEEVGETVRATRSALAVAAPEWLWAPRPERWIERDDSRLEDGRLPDGTHARRLP